MHIGDEIINRQLLWQGLARQKSPVWWQQGPWIIPAAHKFIIRSLSPPATSALPPKAEAFRGEIVSGALHGCLILKGFFSSLPPCKSTISAARYSHFLPCLALVALPQILQKFPYLVISPKSFKDIHSFTVICQTLKRLQSFSVKTLPLELYFLQQCQTGMLCFLEFSGLFILVTGQAWEQFC